MRSTVIDLGPHRNNVATTRADDLAAGRLNVWHNSMPADDLKLLGPSATRVRDIPFSVGEFGTGTFDNVVCQGQRIDVPTGRYDWIYVLACSERRAEDQVALHFDDGAVDLEWLRISDFWPGAAARFGEHEAVRCRTMHFPRHIQAGIEPVVWLQRVPVTRMAVLTHLRLPDNIAIHVFAATLIATADALQDHDACV